MTRESPRDLAVEDRRPRPARSTQAPDALDRRGDRQAEILGASYWHQHREVAVGDEHLHGELPERVRIRRLAGIDQRQGHLAADVARPGAVAPLFFRVGARLAAHGEIPVGRPWAVGIDGRVERAEFLLRLEPLTVADDP